MSKRFRVLLVLKLFVRMLIFFMSPQFVLAFFQRCSLVMKLSTLAAMYDLFVPKSQIYSRNSISKYTLCTQMTYACFACMFIYIFTLFYCLLSLELSILESLDRMCMTISDILQLFLQFLRLFVCVCEKATLRPWFLRLRVSNIWHMHIDIHSAYFSEYSKEGRRPYMYIDLYFVYL